MGSRTRYKKRIPRYNIYGVEQRPPTWNEKFLETHFSEDSDTALSRLLPGFREGAKEKAQALRKKEDEAFWNNFWHGNPEGIPGTKVKGRRQIIEEERDQAIQSQSPKITNIPESLLSDQQKINRAAYGYTPIVGFENPFPDVPTEKLWGTNEQGQYYTSGGEVIDLQKPLETDLIINASVNQTGSSEVGSTKPQQIEEAENKDFKIQTQGNLTPEMESQFDEQVSSGEVTREWDSETDITTITPGPGEPGDAPDWGFQAQDTVNRDAANAVDWGERFDAMNTIVSNLANIASILDSGKQIPGGAQIYKKPKDIKGEMEARETNQSAEQLTATEVAQSNTEIDTQPQGTSSTTLGDVSQNIYTRNDDDKSKQIWRNV